MKSTVPRTVVCVVLGATLLAGCGWTADAPRLASSASSVASASQAPLATSPSLAGSLSAGVLECPPGAAERGAQTPEAPALVSTPRAEVDVTSPVLDAILCVWFRNSLDGTNRGVERSRVPLIEVTDFRKGAQGTKPDQEVNCTQELVIGGPILFAFVMRVQGRTTPEFLVVGNCASVLRAGEAPGTASEWVYDALNKIRKQSVPVATA